MMIFYSRYSTIWCKRYWAKLTKHHQYDWKKLEHFLPPQKTFLGWSLLCSRSTAAASFLSTHFSLWKFQQIVLTLIATESERKKKKMTTTSQLLLAFWSLKGKQKKRFPLFSVGEKSVNLHILIPGFFFLSANWRRRGLFSRNSTKVRLNISGNMQINSLYTVKRERKDHWISIFRRVWPFVSIQRTERLLRER